MWRLWSDLLNDVFDAGSTIDANRVLEVETRSVTMVHSEMLNTCSGNGRENVVVAWGIGVIMLFEEEGVLSNLSSGMLNVAVSTSLSLRLPRLRLGMVVVQQMTGLSTWTIKLQITSNLVHNLKLTHLRTKLIRQVFNCSFPLLWEWYIDILSSIFAAVNPSVIGCNREWHQFTEINLNLN